MVKIKEEISKFSKASFSLGKVGLIVFEKQKDYKTNSKKIEKILLGLGYRKNKDYLELMDNLSAGQKKLFYTESGKKLDGSVLEIVAEFEAGLVNLADKKNKTGLKIANWNPLKTSLIILMSRKQTENSYKRLFEYINLVKSI